MIDKEIDMKFVCAILGILFMIGFIGFVFPVDLPTSFPAYMYENGKEN